MEQVDEDVERLVFLVFADPKQHRSDEIHALAVADGGEHVGYGLEYTLQL